MSLTWIRKDKDVIYESMTERQEYIILKAIELGREVGEFRPKDVGMLLGYKEDRASSPPTVALRKGIGLGLFTNKKYGIYKFVGDENGIEYERQFEEDYEYIVPEKSKA